MRAIISIYIFIQISNSIFCQEVAYKAPLNPNFIDYVNNNTKDIRKSTGGYGLGYIPSPMYIHFNENPNKESTKKSTEEIPVSYDLRALDFVTPVKDQGSLGACWSFSTMGAIESRWKILGYGEFDLSEQNMATCHGFEAGINDGGSAFLATAYMTRLSGPVTEASDPYKLDPNATCHSTGLVHPAYSPIAWLLPDDRNVVKKAIMNYGAVTSSIYMDLGKLSGKYLFYDPVTYTYYYDGTTRQPNHGVLIVGWDDNMAVPAGMAGDDQVGAWIVKNSWGTNFGDDGYFYVAYNDTKFLSEVSLFPEYLPLNSFDSLYMYDYLGATTSYGFLSDTAHALAKFHTDNEIFIKKIGTFVNTSGGVIDIQVYSEFKDSILSNLVAESNNNFVQFPGYQTFDIPVLVDGDYYVKIKYNTPGYNFPIPAEVELSFQGESYAIPEIEPSGKFWISKSGASKDWKPLGSDIENYEADLSIRVYADTLTNLNAFFTANRTYVCKGSEVLFSEQSNGTVNSYEWDFGADATPDKAYTSGPHKVSYTTTGMKSISLTISGPSGTKILQKNSYIEVVDELSIFLPVSEAILIEGKETRLTAFGADNYQWSPTTGLVLNSANGSSVTISGIEDITYTVSGTMGTCTGQASVAFNVVDNPPNDDVCDAIELRVGGWQGKFTNQYATVEGMEPSPPETENGCETPMEWCIEGGLQNSVWFWFTAPPKGMVSISAKGMDNQLALYKAETCDDLFIPGQFEMIAAFDDYYGESEFYAAALDNVTVVPGQKYFLQVDGSAGGVTGKFDLIFWDYPLSVEEFQSEMKAFNDLNVYPNPTEDVFHIKLNVFNDGPVNYKVFDLQGRLVFADETEGYPDLNYELNLGKISNGIYILEVSTQENIYKRNIIKK
jgi:C1A family cysteine protease/PKD repeat protein